MQIIAWSEFLEKALPLDGNNTAITVGVFDGLHRGHKALIDLVVAQDAVPVVVTFKQSHYKKAQNNGREYSGSILSFRQKMAAFESLGISITVVIEFSESFRRMSGADFLHILQKQGKMSFLTVGSNFRCGYRLDTDADAIQNFNARHNIPTAIVPILTEGSVQISSSQIRAAITRGELKDAALMLGHPFTLDLADALVSDAMDGNAVAFGIADLGRILPPPGRYTVCLLGEKTRKKAEILVEGGNIVIDRDLAERESFEYVEF